MSQAQLGTYGQLVSGDADIEQSIGIILGTLAGSVPFNDDYGVPWLDVIDKPIGQAAPIVVGSAQRALEKYEPRITVKRIEPVPQEDGLKVRVHWVPRQGGAERSTLAP